MAMKKNLYIIEWMLMTAILMYIETRMLNSDSDIFQMCGFFSLIITFWALGKAIRRFVSKILNSRYGRNK